jgi:hypothetical protein
MLLIAVVSGIMSAPMIFSPAAIARPVIARPVMTTQAVAPRVPATIPLATTQRAAPWVFMMPNIARPIQPAKNHPKPPIYINGIPQRFAVTPQHMLSCVDGYVNPQVLHATICPPLAPVP